VPKVKLGDKITALQQIVSPFGKVYVRSRTACMGNWIVSFMRCFPYIDTVTTSYYVYMSQTDTASVLYEAINYIKWLHEQVQVTTSTLLHVWFSYCFFFK
jgi:hypothetical protein